MPHDILIVDDEAPVRRVIRRKLEQFGHRIREAANGEQALRLLYEATCDLVITDLIMPDMDGLEMIHRLRKQQSKVKILAMSAHGTMNLDAARALGASRALQKPFKLDALVTAVDALLEPRPPGR